MFVIIGGAGNVGHATCAALRNAGAPVKAIVRDRAKAAKLVDIGCEIAIADLRHPDDLASVIAATDAVQVILPLSPSAGDPAKDMIELGESITHALSSSRPARILAISDYGAHVETDIGMPSIFQRFEALLPPLASQKLILRSAEHMHNWGRNLQKTLESGVLSTFQEPIDLPQAQISAQDLGKIAANLLMLPRWEKDLTIVHAEGPRRYSAADVAAVMSDLADGEVVAQAIPRAQWDAILSQSMPPSLAGLLIKANDAKNKGGLVDIEKGVGEVIYGRTELAEGLRLLLSDLQPR